MRRTSLLAALVPAAVVAGSWLRLEDPRHAGEAALVVVLGLVPTVVRSWWGRAVAVAGGALVTLWLAFAAPPWDLLLLRGLWWERVGTRGDTALRDFNDVFVPFDSVERWELHGLVLVAIYALTAGIALCAAAGRPLLGVAAVVVGAGVPATLLEERVGIVAGAVILAACLWLVAASNARWARANLGAVVVGAAVVLVAASTAGAGGVPHKAAVDWKAWELYARARGQVGVGYVWDANYDGIRFPPERTTVLRVRGPSAAHYWRASTLDAFDGARWRESLVPIGVRAPQGRLPVDPLLPASAYDPGRWVRQQVEVVALRTNRLPAASTPVALATSSFGQVALLGGGVVGYADGLEAGDRYTVWSYAPRPRSEQLAASPAIYPEAVSRYLTLGRASLPVFGDARHDAILEERLALPYHGEIAQYRPVWALAQRLTRSARTPYATTLALERWFRATGGFTYDEQPPRLVDPPLSEFVLDTKRGYCQHFAGAMTLMLRFLGIPARVAVGFTNGALRDGVWNVTDHDAHAWVEVWFEGWGWLPFDPTPGRGAFAQTYTVASSSADAVIRLGGRPFIPLEPGPEPADGGAVPADDGGATPWTVVVLLALLAPFAGLGLLKSARRRLRYRTADPRRLASAARLELAERLRDQGLKLPTPATFADVGLGLQAVGISGAGFTEAAARARYGPPAGAEAAAREARRQLRAVVRLLREVLPARRRLRGYLSLRSLRSA